MSDNDQLPLFDLTPARRAPKMATAGKAVTYRRYHPARRMLCDECIRAVHRDGIAVAPLPQVVRWRRVRDGVVDHLCHRHRLNGG